jgi:hypothetical protein
MKTFKEQAAQGDVLIRRIKQLPKDVSKQESNNSQYIVAHSETGHHHTVAAEGTQFFHAANDPMIMYLVVDNEVDLVHNRGFDTHETIRFDAGIYEIRRQREYVPEGWRMVAD